MNKFGNMQEFKAWINAHCKQSSSPFSIAKIARDSLNYMQLSFMDAFATAHQLNVQADSNYTALKTYLNEIESFITK